jgi:hypothetical protein
MAGNAVEISQQQLTSARADFVADDFDVLVAQKGLVLQHEQTYKCSCIREINGSALSDCPDCHGGGYIFGEPCNIKGVIQAINYDPKFMQYSEINVGTAMLTVRYTNRLGWRDRITVKNGETVFMENTFPRLREVNGDQELSSLLTYNVLSVDKIFYNQTIDPSSCKTQLELQQDVDYTIEGRKLKLSDDLMQQLIQDECEKAYISIRYTHNPTYLVMDIQKDIRNTLVIENDKETLKNLPINCVIKKAHFEIGDLGYGSNATTL